MLLLVLVRLGVVVRRSSPSPAPLPLQCPQDVDAGHRHEVGSVPRELLLMVELMLSLLYGRQL